MKNSLDRSVSRSWSVAHHLATVVLVWVGVVRGHVGVAGVRGVGVTVTLGRGTARTPGPWTRHRPLNVWGLVLGKRRLPPTGNKLLKRQVAYEHIYFELTINNFRSYSQSCHYKMKVKLSTCFSSF